MSKPERTMSAEHLAALKAGRNANSAKYAKQVITIEGQDTNGKPITWTVKRDDEMNWTVLKDGKFDGFFSSILSAFNALPGKMLNEEAKTSLALIQEAQTAIMRRIAVAFLDLRKL
jgi:hypothetical protein